MSEITFFFFCFVLFSRKQREIRRLEFEEEENERQLLKRELELKRQRAAQPKPIWRPKTPKKKRSNYCGKQQNWN